MSDQPRYLNLPCPFLFFDVVGPFGHLNGTIEIELAARTLTPVGTDEVSAELVPTAHLRCTPAVATFLRDTLDAALRLAEKANEPQTAMSAAHLN